jgi:hypothetical protein
MGITRVCRPSGDSLVCDEVVPKPGPSQNKGYGAQNRLGISVFAASLGYEYRLR